MFVALRILPPLFNRFAAGKFIEPQILPADHLGQHDDLTRVHREMLRDVQDRIQDGNFAALDGPPFGEPRRVERRQDGVRVGHGPAEPGKQLGTRDHRALIEFLLTIPCTGGAADSADDPLPHVAAQVQDQIAD